MIDLQVQMVLDGPEVWVPSLAVILERYRGNQEATSAVFLRLINLGLVQVVQDPNRPDQMALDTRMLEHYLSQYGPRVTTASGQLGVAATRGEIWTPESAAGGGAVRRSGHPGPRRLPPREEENRRSSSPATEIRLADEARANAIGIPPGRCPERRSRSG